MDQSLSRTYVGRAQPCVIPFPPTKKHPTPDRFDVHIMCTVVPVVRSWSKVVTHSRNSDAFTHPANDSSTTVRHAGMRRPGSGAVQCCLGFNLFSICFRKSRRRPIPSTEIAPPYACTTTRTISCTPRFLKTWLLPSQLIYVGVFVGTGQGAVSWRTHELRMSNMSETAVVSICIRRTHHHEQHPSQTCAQDKQHMFQA